VFRDHFTLLLGEALAATLLTTEEVFKVELEIAEVESLATTTAVSLSLGVLLYTFFTLLVVNASLFRVGKHLVCVRDFLKLFLGSIRVITVLVRMVLDRQLFECLLNLVFACIPLDAHDFVVIFTRVFWLLLLLLLPLASTATELLSATTELLPASKIELKLLGCNACEAESLDFKIVTNEHSDKQYKYWFNTCHVFNCQTLTLIK
jgi:hypothetical protein